MAGLIASGVLEQIRAASEIVDVVGGYLPLKRAGGNFTALCPFHREKTPSFHVNPHRQIFHCFGCHKGGDVFRFVQYFENISFVEAVRRLAERSHIALEFDQTPGQAQARHLKEQLWQIHEQITQRWQTALRQDAAGAIARDYLAQRGVPQEAIDLFRLGYAPEAWDDTVNWARGKGFDLATVEKAGLIIRKDDRYYDRFRGRLMFPICDEQGRVAAFSGRVLRGDEKTAKYVNSPETPLFTKSKLFFGLDKSRRHLLDEQTAVICEGQLDLIACFQAGVRNVVAPQGTALTADHARILKRYVEEVILCFDSDTAGQEAAGRSLDHLLPLGMAVRVAVVPAPHDPDSFIKAHGGEAFQRLVREARGFFDYYLDRLCDTNDPSTDKGRMAVLQRMAATVLKTGNRVVVDKYAQKTALRLGVSPEAVREEFRKGPRTSSHFAESEEVVMNEPEVSAASPQEGWLMKLVLLDEEAAETFRVHGKQAWIQHPVVREILEKRISDPVRQNWQGVAAFLAEFPGEDMVRFISEAVTEERPIPNPAQQVQDLLVRLRNQALDRELAQLSLIMERPETADEARVEALRQMQLIRQAKRRPLVQAADGPPE